MTVTLTLTPAAMPAAHLAGAPVAPGLPPGGPTPTTTRLGVSRNGVAFTFAAPVEAGQYADGSWFVVDPGAGVVVTSVTPAGASEDTSGYAVPQGVRRLHGMMVNPGGGQGFDSYLIAGGPAYDPALDVDPATAGAPLVALAGQSLVKAVSVAGDPAGPGRWSAIRRYVVLTVVDAVPPAGSFRPPVTGTDKTPYWSESALDLAIFRALPVPAEAPTLAAVRATQRVGGVFQSWSADAVSGRAMQGIEHFPDDAHAIARRLGEALMHLNFDHAEAQKRLLLIPMVQTGIDLDGFARAGGFLPALPGATEGRKGYHVLAALALGDVAMLARTGTARNDVGRFTAAGQLPGASPWGGDDDSFFTVPAELAGVEPAAQADPAPARRLAYAGDDAGMPEWWAGEPFTFSHNLSDPDRSAMARAHLATVLAVHLTTGAAEGWNNAPFLDHFDRVAALLADERDGPLSFSAGGNWPVDWAAIPAWLRDAWSAWRGLSPRPVWTGRPERPFPPAALSYGQEGLSVTPDPFASVNGLALERTDIRVSTDGTGWTVFDDVAGAVASGGAIAVAIGPAFDGEDVRVQVRRWNAAGAGPWSVNLPFAAGGALRGVVGVPPLVVDAQTLVFGALTLAGAGAVGPVTGSGFVVQLEKTGNGTAAAEYDVVEGARLAPSAAGAGALTDGGTVELVANGSTVFTVTAEVVPGLFSVASEAEEAEAWDLATPGLHAIGRRGAEPYQVRPSVAIETARATVIAGEAVRVRAAPGNGPAWWIRRQAHFRWAADESYAFRSLPADTKTPLVSGEGTGAYWAHVFETPGEHTIALETVEPTGKLYPTATLAVTVLDPDVEFAGARTICWSLSGSFEGAPDGARCCHPAGVTPVDLPAGGAAVETTLDGALALADNAATGGRLLLHAGETYPVTSFSDDFAYSHNVRLLGRFGTGADPVIERSGGFTGALVRIRGNGLAADPAVDHSVLRDVEIRGQYDPGAPAPSPDPSIGCVGVTFADEPQNVTFYRVRISGLGAGLFASFGNTWTLADCEITDWADYGILMTVASGCRIVGSHVHQNANAINRPGTRESNLRPGVPSFDAWLADGTIYESGGRYFWASDDMEVLNYARHGPFRAAYCHEFGISRSRFFNNAGWTGPQPTLRLATGAAPEGEHRTSVTEVHIDGPSLSLAFTTGFAPEADRPGEHLFERIHWNADFGYSRFLFASKLGVTIRDCHVVQPPEDPITSFRILEIGFSEAGFGQQTRDRPTRIYANTLELAGTALTGVAVPVSFNLGSSGLTPADYPLVASADNLFVAPLSATPHPDYGTLADGVPAPGSAALGAATGDVRSLFDFAGNVRPASRAVGAFERTDAVGPSFVLGPEIAGDVRVGRRAHARALVHGHPAPAIARRWDLDGGAVAGATGATYDPVATDAGGSLSVEVTATNASASASATSAGVTVGTEAFAPVITAGATVSGVASVNRVLTVSDPAVDAVPAPAFSYQWRRNGADIGAATSAAYLLSAPDQGATVDCVVTVTNAAGSAASTAGAGVIGAPVAPAVSIDNGWHSLPAPAGPGYTSRRMTVAFGYTRTQDYSGRLFHNSVFNPQFLMLSGSTNGRLVLRTAGSNTDMFQPDSYSNGTPLDTQVGILIVIDTAGGLSGGKLARAFFAGAERGTPVTMPVAQYVNPASLALWADEFGASKALGHVHGGIWMAPVAIEDPSMFFDPVTQDMIVPADGVVAGVTPTTWIRAEDFATGANAGTGADAAVNGTFTRV